MSPNGIEDIPEFCRDHIKASEEIRLDHHALASRVESLEAARGAITLRWTPQVIALTITLVGMVGSLAVTMWQARDNARKIDQLIVQSHAQQETLARMDERILSISRNQ